jgi:acylpyruvate hydrolase
VRLCTITSAAAPDPFAAVLRDGEPVAVRRDNGELYTDVGAVLAEGEAGQRDAARARDGGPTITDSVTIMRPVLAPGATWCVGRNYLAHIRETRHEPPPAPVWFGKFARSLADPDADVTIPAIDDHVDYEGELAVVIGRPVRRIDLAEAWSAVAGITLFNDISLRALGVARQNVFYGKNLERSSALGPTVVTTDELPEFGELRFTLTVNGEPRQHGDPSDLLFDVPTLICDLAALTTLHPGDVIATGTPGGVAMGENPPRWLRAGDVVELSCPQLGMLRTRFV